ncbi:hypothetical protein SVIOM342S_09696 [Streptomyces violaceorubidus]
MSWYQSKASRNERQGLVRPDSEGPAVGAAISQGTLLSMPYAVDELVKAAEQR